ncbi:hypothetical protein CBL_09623 [Carabus blaptoides fortunei]
MLAGAIVRATGQLGHGHPRSCIHQHTTTALGAEILLAVTACQKEAKGPVEMITSNISSRIGFDMLQITNNMVEKLESFLNSQTDKISNFNMVRQNGQLFDGKRTDILGHYRKRSTVPWTVTVSTLEQPAAGYNNVGKTVAVPDNFRSSLIT